MKTLSSVLLVLAAAAVPAFADSAYFLPTSASSTRAAVPAVASSTAVSTDRVSVTYRPMTRAIAAKSAKMPMVFMDRRYNRGSAQAVIVR